MGKTRKKRIYRATDNDGGWERKLIPAGAPTPKGWYDSQAEALGGEAPKATAPVPGKPAGKKRIYRPTAEPRGFERQLIAPDAPTPKGWFDSQEAALAGGKGAGEGPADGEGNVPAVAGGER